MIRWERSPDKSTYVASYEGAVLTASRSVSGRWTARVDKGADSASSPEVLTRSVAQRWAEHRAGAA